MKTFARITRSFTDSTDFIIINEDIQHIYKINVKKTKAMALRENKIKYVCNLIKQVSSVNFLGFNVSCV